MATTRMTSWLCLDQRSRWQKGDPVRVEGYLEKPVETEVLMRAVDQYSHR